MGKFFFIKETQTEGTLYSEDGGVAILWHNGEHMLGQCYKERISPKLFSEEGIETAFEEMINDSSNSSIFDFKNEDEILPSQLEQLSDWLICFDKDDFFENLTLFNLDDYDESVVEEELNKALTIFFDNEYFKERAGEEV